MKRRSFSVAEAAKVLGISRQRVHQLIQQRGLEPERLHVGGYTVLMLSAADLAQLRDRPTGRPRTRKA
jgi:excisionase family DNA binding protein